MESQTGCSICMRPYTKVIRKEMMLCANHHLICLDCSKRILKRNSLCPFCKELFDIGAIQPRRAVSEEPQPEKGKEREREKGKIERKDGGREVPRQEARVCYDLVEPVARRQQPRQNNNRVQGGAAKKDDDFGWFVLLMGAILIAWLVKKRGL